MLIYFYEKYIIGVISHVLGIGLGVSTTVATVYTMEIATPNMRGRLAVIPAIGTFIENRMKVIIISNNIA